LDNQTWRGNLVIRLYANMLLVLYLRMHHPPNEDLVYL